MNEQSNESAEYTAVEILAVSGSDRTRIARRWVFGVLVVQAAILIVLLNARGIWFSLPGPDRSTWSGPLWVAWYCVCLGASVAWPTSAIVGPMAVTAACLAGVESRRRTLTCVAVSILLTGVPWLVVSWVIGPGTR